MDKVRVHNITFYDTEMHVSGLDADSKPQVKRITYTQNNIDLICQMLKNLLEERGV